ncbi:hypothetical protein [Phenylobacterium sp.]|uniref:hypothetical protein n=1 Tax=Phenylobacterium sp. TaxID=1871053 RepID=UPI00120C89CF|nr:hypothetical protein [Phenylobacterium sp.]THD58628.1 MAG: hypothetical protein E8A49_19100 [Phenylobacterium sp.]
MKKLLIILAATTAIGGAGLAGCASDGHHYFGGGGGGYDAYYDDFYGPYVDGYWGDDGVFMFRHERGGEFARDESHHFRRDTASGFHGVRAGHAPAGGAARPAAGRPG